MKFVGSSPKDCLGKLASKKFQKYFDADAIITVPSDYYQGIIDEADKHIEKLNNQLVHAKDNGNKELAESIQQKINKYTKIKNSVKDSGVSNAEARYARLHPKLSTAKDVTKIAHEAGLEQAAYGAIIGGGISLIKNIVAVIKGEKNPKEAGRDFAKDTGASAGISYTTAFSGSFIKGGMQNSASKTIQSVSKTNLPATIVTSIVEAGKTLRKFFSGNITGLECLEELGEKGTGQLSAAMFAVAGQTLIPNPVVGAIIGSMVGYVLSSACYGVLIDALKGEKLAKEERIRIEKECKESIKMIIQFREEMNMSVEKYLFDMKDTFNKAFILAEKSIRNDDIDGFISTANSMSIKLGSKPQFTGFKEFEALMESDSVLKL